MMNIIKTYKTRSAATRAYENMMEKAGAFATQETLVAFKATYRVQWFTNGTWAIVSL